MKIRKNALKKCSHRTQTGKPAVASEREASTVPG